MTPSTSSSAGPRSSGATDLATGRLVARISQPSDTLAVTAAGCIPYYADLYTIDQLGLTAPDLEVLRPGRDAAGACPPNSRGRALLARQPHFLFGSAVVTPADKVQRALYTEPGWEEAFDREYRTASVSPPELGEWRVTFAVRKDIAPRVARALQGP